MKATEAKLLRFLLESLRFVIQIYQRTRSSDAAGGLSSLEVLPYVLGLVPQSYEREMGNGGQA